MLKKVFDYLNKLNKEDCFCGEWKDGIRVVCTKDHDNVDVYFYERSDGKRFGNFKKANDFNCNFGLTIDSEDGLYRYVDRNGNLSEGYTFATNYSSGIGVVKVDDKYYFRDENGALSGPFYYAGEYGASYSGFSYVKEKEGADYRYRDLLGRITDIPSESGKAFYSFYSEAIDFDDLDPDLFLDDAFYNGVASHLMNKYRNLINNAYTENGEIPHKAEVFASIKLFQKGLDEKKTIALEREQERLKAKEFMERHSLERQKAIEEYENEIRSQEDKMQALNDLIDGQLANTII